MTAVVQPADERPPRPTAGIAGEKPGVSRYDRRGRGSGPWRSGAGPSQFDDRSSTASS
jgi:hypothetical protein